MPDDDQLNETIARELPGRGEFREAADAVRDAALKAGLLFDEGRGLLADARAVLAELRKLFVKD